MTSRPGACDAIVVGGGPAGALVAHLLSERGLRVRVLEASATVRRKVCGEYLCPSGALLLEELGLTHLVSSRPITGMRLVSPSGRVVAADFPSAEGRPGIGRALNRRLFDEALLDRARASGAEVTLGARVTRLERTPAGYRVEVKGDGGASVLEAALLVGADGRRSSVAGALGLRLEPPHDRIALHGHFRSPWPNGNHGEMHLLAEGAYIGVDPTGDRETNVSLVCSAARVRELGGARATMDHFVRRAPDYARRYGPFPGDAPLAGVHPITHRVRSPIAPSAALVGDAAGFLDPLTGEGITFALLGARLLASAILEGGSLAPHALEAALRRYARARARALGPKWRMNTAFQWLIARPDRVEAVARFLAADGARATGLLGAIGNVYGPAEGLARTLLPRKTGTRCEAGTRHS